MVHMDSIDEELQSNGEFALAKQTDSNNIILYPFAHQVGGHTQLLTLDKSTLCKPLIPRELLFYLNVPKELVKFVPFYKGVVQIREIGTGNFPPVIYQPLRSPKCPYSQSVTDLYNSSFELKVQLKQCSDEKILKKNLSQDNLLKADYISRPNEKYLLLLENVASKYQMPCILDLKMGTRQHGVDATEEKRHRQIAKCQASTSASLGVRLCGMQVYQVDYGGFLWYDKYYGRKMDVDGLKRALHQYFQNGSQLNEDIIDDVIDRLKLLSKAVENSPSFRFYGTSLLIIHEGCTSRSNTKRCPVDVRLIDFAHTICDYSSTNGRSGSSPAVLKSSSADQLSVQQTTTDGIHMNENDAENLRPLQSMKQQPLQSFSRQEQQLPPSSQHQPPPSDMVESDIENNNNSISTNIDNANNEISRVLNQNINITSKSEADIIQDPSETTLGGELEISPLSLNSTTTTAPTNPIDSSGIDNNTSNSFLNATTTTSSTINNNNNNNSIKQTHSTPTTPPSLGSRKISKTPMGPDKGLLFGLENLMRLLDDLKSETLITTC